MKTAKHAISESAARAVPIVDEHDRVLGLLTEGDLIRDPNIELILVDHHEFTQASTAFRITTSSR